MNPNVGGFPVLRSCQVFRRGQRWDGVELESQDVSRDDAVRAEPLRGSEDEKCIPIDKNYFLSIEMSLLWSNEKC